MKLSQAQARVVDALLSNNKFYIQEGPFYNYQQVVDPEGHDIIIGDFTYKDHHVLYFTIPTLECLKNTGCLESIEKGRFKLKNN